MSATPSPLATARDALPVGATLQMAWQLFRASFIACLPLALPAICAGGAPQAFAAATRHSLDLWWWLVYALGTLLMLLCYGAIILRQHGLLVGNSVGLAASLRHSLARLPAVLFAMLLMTPLLLLGLALLVIPGLAVGLCLLLAWPTLLLERCGPVTALLRSARLLRGNLWRLLGLFALALAGVLVFVILAGVFAGVLMSAAMGAGASPAPGTRALGTLVLSLILVPPVVYLSALLVTARLRLSPPLHPRA